MSVGIILFSFNTFPNSTIGLVSSKIIVFSIVFFLLSPSFGFITEIKSLDEFNADVIYKMDCCLLFGIG